MLTRNCRLRFLFQDCRPSRGLQSTFGEQSICAASYFRRSDAGTAVPSLMSSNLEVRASEWSRNPCCEQ